MDFSFFRSSLRLYGEVMHDDKGSQNQRIQFKCPACGWDGRIDETAYDEILGLHRCPNCSNYELKKIMH